MTKSNSPNCRQQISLEEILQHTESMPSGCIEWRKTRIAAGYGQIWLRGTMVLVHREVTRLVHGEPQAKAFALHSCDNPSCVNPNHLSWGSHAENMRQMWARGRSTRKPFNLPMRKFTDEQIRMMRLSKDAGQTYAALGRAYGVSANTIKAICLRLTYREVY